MLVVILLFGLFFFPLFITSFRYFFSRLSLKEVKKKHRHKLYDYFDAQIFSIEMQFFRLMCALGIAQLVRKKENIKIIVIVGLNGFIGGAKYNTIPLPFFSSSLV